MSTDEKPWDYIALHYDAVAAAGNRVGGDRRPSQRRDLGPHACQGSGRGSQREACRAGRASSTDGGKTWTELPPTLQAKTSLTGLTAGSTAQFRYRAVVKAGAGDWSPPLSYLVK